jgi:predicted ester cyclase
MSVEANKAAIRTYFEEFWDNGNDAAADAFNHPDCIVHFPDAELRGPEDVKEFAAPFRAGFSDISVKADQLVGEDDMVAGRWTCNCIHTGEFMGVAATGNAVSFGGFFTMRIVGGKRAESWELMDTPSLMAQISS